LFSSGAQNMSPGIQQWTLQESVAAKDDKNNAEVIASCLSISELSCRRARKTTKELNATMR